MNTSIRPRGRAPSGKNGKPMLWKYTGIDSEQWYEDDGSNTGSDFKKPEQKHAAPLRKGDGCVVIGGEHAGCTGEVSAVDADGNIYVRLAKSQLRVVLPQAQVRRSAEGPAERKRKSKQGHSRAASGGDAPMDEDDVLNVLAKKYPSDLTDLLLSKRKRDEDAKAIKAAVHEEMSVKMDTGVRVNQQLKKALLGKS